MPDAPDPRHRAKSARSRIRHSLALRLLVVCVAIAAASIATTAWIASTSTSGAIRQQYSDDLAATSGIYDEVLGYAAAHKSWADVGTAAHRIEGRTQRGLILTDPSGKVLFSSTGKGPPRGTKPTAGVDPLSVTALPGTTPAASSIDPRAVGPLRLSDADAAALADAAKRAADCLRRTGFPNIDTRQDPTGRTVLSPSVKDPVGTPRECPLGALGPTKSERQWSAELVKQFNQCVDGRAPGLGGDFGPPREIFTDTSAQGPVEKECMESAWRQIVGPYVAPRALLYVTGTTTLTPAGGLSHTAKLRIVFAGLAILLGAVVLCALAATTILRPIRALTTAARQVGRGDRSARVVTRDGGQIGDLAVAFNRMSVALDIAEDNRRRMVSDIAHELRTPLGNLRAWLEAAQDGVVTLDEKLAGSLLEESLLVQRVVEDLQELALADAGKLVFHPEPLDAGALARQVCAAHQAAAEKAGITLATAASDPVPLTADVSRLRQALGNLVSNAIRYTPAGGSVDVRASHETGEVTLEVEDTGVGLRPEEIGKVFERFWRAEQSRSRASGGSGLGLAIARHLVEAQGGRLRVRSEYGVGSVFTIVLPAGE